MKKEQTRILNKAVKWAGQKNTQRTVSVEWSKPWHDKEIELKFSINVSDNELGQYAILPEGFKGDISTLLCQTKQESLTNEMEQLQDRLEAVKAGCK